MTSAGSGQSDTSPNPPAAYPAGFVNAYGHLEPGTDFLWDLADLIAETLQVNDLIIYVRHGDSLLQAAAYGVKAPDRGSLLDRITIPVGHAIVGRAASTGQTILTRDIRDDPNYVADHFAGLSELTVPVRLGTNTVAVFDSESQQVDGFAPWQVTALEEIAIIAAPAIELWRVETEDELRAEESRTRQAEALGTFAGSLAHDLNNLLGIVELNAELLRRAPAAATSAADSLSKMVERARLLTGRLLALTTRGTLSLEIVDVRSLLSEAADMAALVPGIDVTIELPDELPVLRADPVQLPQLLLNLVTNAIEAMGGSGSLTLGATATDADPPTVTISVSDDGPGIHPDNLDRIFDPYFTTKPNGLGLGLASSYWTALRHEGNLAVRAPTKGGTTFELTLPAIAGRVVVAPPTAPSVDPLRLLLLEDDPELGEVLGTLLERLGHRHELVVIGEQVLPSWRQAIVDQDPFDIALLDLRNEIGGGGVEAIRDLRAVYPEARAVAMSGYADHTLEQSRSAGFSATLAKPFQADELAIALVQALAAFPPRSDRHD